MKVTLINKPSLDPVQLCGEAAATCTNSKNFEKAFKAAIDSGHNSVLEHAYYTFKIEGVSRALLAQLTRHRIASFSVQSQRYVSLADRFDYVIPPRISELGEDAENEYKEQMRIIHGFYKGWQERLGGKTDANEDARFVLPNACTTSITMSMNARELRHFFSLRCCNRAQWEIRDMACRMLEIMREEFPMAFNDAGPECLRTKCPEGKRTCGKPWRKEGEKK